MERLVKPLQTWLGKLEWHLDRCVGSISRPHKPLACLVWWDITGGPGWDHLL